MKTKILMFIISIVCSVGVANAYTPTEADWGREIYSMYMEYSDNIYFMKVDLYACKEFGGCSYRKGEFQRRYFEIVDLAYKLGDYCQMYLDVADGNLCKIKAEYLATN